MTAKDGPTAIANADNWGSYNPPGYCLKFVRQEAWKIGGLYASAIDAWNGATKRHPGDRNPPDGAPCFYRGGTYGHIVIYRKHGSGQMRSTDCTYSGKVSNAALSWPESAWGDDYLGWTEDLNGVTLPLSTTPTPTPKDEDMPDYASAKSSKAVKLKDGQWVAITWDSGSNDKWFDGYGILLSKRQFSAALTVNLSGRNGAVVDTSFVETESGDAVETYATVGHGALDNCGDTRNGLCQEGRRLRARVRVRGGDATLDSARITVLSWVNK